MYFLLNFVLYDLALGREVRIRDNSSAAFEGSAMISACERLGSGEWFELGVGRGYVVVLSEGVVHPELPTE